MKRNKLVSLLRNEYLYAIITKLLMVAVSLAESVLLARYLGASLKGVSTFINSATQITSIVIIFGMHQTYPFLRKKYGKEQIYDSYISSVLLIFGAYLLLSMLIGTLIVKESQLQAIVLLTPLIGLNSVLGYVCLIETPNRRNAVELICSVAHVLFLLLLFLLTKSSLFFAVLILTISAAARIVVYAILLKPRIHLHSELPGFTKELLRLGFFPMLALLMTSLNYQVDVLMLKAYPYISSAAIGIYSIGISVSNKIVLIPDTLKFIMVSKLAKGAPDEEVARVLRLCFSVGCLLCVLFLLIGNWGIALLYGTEYEGAYPVMAISAVGAVMIGYFKLIAQYNIIRGEQRITVLLLSISIFVNIVLNLILIPAWQLNGAALATCVSHFVCGIIFCFWFRKCSGIPLHALFIPRREDFKLLRDLTKRDRGAS